MPFPTHQFTQLQKKHKQTNKQTNKKPDSTDSSKHQLLVEA
jgi:hypothetical protein